MDRIKTNIGIDDGMPFCTPQLEFLQSSFQDIVTGLATMFGENFIVSGCEIDGANNVSPGYVCLSGEIMKCPGGNAGADPCLAISETTGNEVEFNDGSKHEIHIYREALVATTGVRISDLRHAASELLQNGKDILTLYKYYAALDKKQTEHNHDSVYVKSSYSAPLEISRPYEYKYPSGGRYSGIIHLRIVELNGVCYVIMDHRVAAPRGFNFLCRLPKPVENWPFVLSTDTAGDSRGYVDNEGDVYVYHQNDHAAERYTFSFSFPILK